MSDTFWKDNNIGVLQNKPKQGMGCYFVDSVATEACLWRWCLIWDVDDEKTIERSTKDIPESENSKPNVSSKAKSGILHTELKAIQCGEQECSEWGGGGDR